LARKEPVMSTAVAPATIDSSMSAGAVAMSADAA
jgi:hypothetical protein